MKYVYWLSHSYVTGYTSEMEEIREVFSIGYFSSYQKACEAIDQVKDAVGFKSYPDGFSIEKIEIDYDDFDFI